MSPGQGGPQEDRGRQQAARREPRTQWADVLGRKGGGGKRHGETNKSRGQTSLGGQGAAAGSAERGTNPGGGGKQHRVSHEQKGTRTPTLRRHVPPEAIAGRGCPGLTRIHPGLGSHVGVALPSGPMRVPRGEGGSRWPMAGGGGKLRSAIFRNFPQFRNFSQFSAIFRNFPQFSAIFPQFFTLPDFLTTSPRWCRTMRIFFFLLFHTLSNVAKSPEPGIAQLVVQLHCSSRVLGSNPVGHNMVTFAFLVFLPSLFWSFSCLHVCMFACACPMCQRLQSNGAYTSAAMLLI